jgi:hypothetical protein
VQIAHAITEATMAQRVTVELEDDLDGGPAAETLRFGLGGSEYEIDLSKKNASTFPPADRALHRTFPEGGPRAAPPAGAYRIKP